MYRRMPGTAPEVLSEVVLILGSYWLRDRRRTPRDAVDSSVHPLVQQISFTTERKLQQSR